jgi:hypothetical protein
MAGTLVLGVVAGTPARAVPVTFNIDITATSFDPNNPKIDPVRGSFTLTFDPAASGTGNVTLNSLNIQSIDPITYLYDGSNGSGVLVIGTKSPGSLFAGVVHQGSNEFFFSINNFRTNPSFAGFVYSQLGSTQNTWFSTTASAFSVVQTTPPTPTPLPATLPLLASVLAGAGFFRRCRRRWLTVDERVAGLSTAMAPS